MINYFMTKLYKCENLFNLSSYLEELLAATHSVPNRNEILQEIYSEVLLNKLINPEKSYNVYKHNKSVVCYLMQYWIFRKTYMENAEYLFKIINTIQQEMIEPQKKNISIKSIHRLMEAAEKRFKFCSKVLYSKPLDILIINHSHTYWNGIYSSAMINDCEIKDTIILPYLRYEVDFPQEFIFLHELGHVLHTRITKISMTPPDSFNMVINRMFPTLQDAPNNQKAELFADCFAISVLCGSDLKQYNPYTFISLEDCIILAAYMVDLIDKSFPINQPDNIFFRNAFEC